MAGECNTIQIGFIDINRQSKRYLPLSTTSVRLVVDRIAIVQHSIQKRKNSQSRVVEFFPIFTLFVTPGVFYSTQEC